MIELIDKIKQKNNGKFKLVDAEDVDYDGDGKKSVRERIEEIAQQSGNVGVMTDEDIDKSGTEQGRPCGNGKETGRKPERGSKRCGKSG